MGLWVFWVVGTVGGSFQTAGCCWGDEVRSTSKHPNVVLIVADDLGFGELGCYGQTKIKTPRLDQLATEGVRFTQFYSGNAVCAPSRCCLMTAKHPGHAYIRNNGTAKAYQHLKAENGWEFPGQNPIPDSEVTLAECFKKAGYATGAFGKWGLGHFGTPGSPNRQGFDLFYGFNCQAHAHNHYPRFLWRNNVKELQPGNDRTLYGETYSQDRFVEEALAFIDEHKAEPFFVYLPFAVPHLAIQAPEEAIAPYLDELPEADYEHRGYLKHPTPRAGYAAMISYMDQGIGEIIDRIESLGLTEETIFVFTSDNGPTYDRLGGSDSEFFDSASGFRGRKGSLYEGGIRVPLIVSWKGMLPVDVVRDQPGAFWDLFPTLLDLADVPLPEVSIDGVSLSPCLADASAPYPHDYLYWEFPAYGGQQAIRVGDWKLVRQNLMRSKADSPYELYHLADDPQESRDVAADNPDVVQRLAKMADQARERSELFPFPKLDSSSDND